MLPLPESAHPVSFAARHNTVESDVKDDLEKFHAELLEASPQYNLSVKKATSKKPVVVTVTHEALPYGAAATSYGRRSRNYIGINPSATIENASLRTARSALINDARQSLIFEMKNLASARQNDSIDNRARSGRYELARAGDSLPPIATSLVNRPGDLPAAKYAIDVEKQEYESAKILKEIADDISASPAIDNLQVVIPAPSKFEDYLAGQIKGGHTQGYLDQYDQLRGK